MGRHIAAAVLAVAGLAACGDEAKRASSPTPTPASSAFRVVGRPLVFFGPASEGGPLVLIYVRLNRKLPSSKLEEGARANFLVDGSGGLDAPPERVGRRTRYCYFGNLSNEHPAPTLTDPHDGQRVTLQVLIAGGRDKVEARATLRGPMGLHSGLTPRRKAAMVAKLCGRGH